MSSEFPIENLLDRLRSDNSPHDRRAAEVELKERRDPGSITALLIGLGHSDASVRRPVASTLFSLLDDPKIIPVFKTALIKAFETALSDTSRAVRRIAINALVKIGDASTLPKLLDYWDDGDIRVHKSVLEAIRRFTPEVPFEFFVNVLSNHRSRYRADAAQVLEWIDNHSVIPVLLNARYDEDLRVRQRVMHALVAMGEKSIVPDLIPDLTSQNIKAAVAAAKALGRIGDPAAVPALVSALNDRHALIRATAATSLGDIGDPISLEPLEHLISDQETYDYDAALGILRAGVAMPLPRVSTAAIEASAKIRVVQSLKTIRFSAYYPKEIVSNSWHTAYVYVFGINAAELVNEDAAALLGREINEHRSEHETVSIRLREQTIIKVRPWLDGFEVNPPYQVINFSEPWHRLEFRLRATEKYLRKTSNGLVSIMINGATVCDIPISIHVRANSQISLQVESHKPEIVTQTHTPYQSIFCSYSHRDAAVVKRVERVCRVLGMTYLRDNVSLRSGENWSAELLAMIERADVFQLFWSKNAADSGSVEQEWRHAYKLGREAERFIRPVYWTEPMPPPPTELAHLHFAFAPEL